MCIEMTRVGGLTWLLAGAMIALALPLGAQTVKWRDERGVVTYSNVPPPESASGVRVDSVPPVISTYSSAQSMGNMGNSGNAGNMSREAAAPGSLRARVEALERELEIERRARALASQMVSNQAAQEAEAREKRRKALREQCIADRRVDCDTANLEAPAAPVVVVARPVVIRPLSPPLPPPPRRSEQRVMDRPAPTGIPNAPGALLRVNTASVVRVR